jgi:uncharacterized membrane protein YkvA (DUF1232 family)
MQDGHDAEEIEAAARELVRDARASELPDFIGERLAKLETIINMIRDEEWNVSDEDRKHVLGALVYFCDPEDLIPDHVPGLGFLDDAIYVELIIRELSNEIAFYEEFCEFRTAEEARRKAKGLDPYVERGEWLADKRAALHARMRSKGKGLMSSRGWRLSW